MKLILVFAILLCSHAFAVSFNCSSYGMINVFVEGQIDGDYTITLIDLPFKEEVHTVTKVNIDLNPESETFVFHAENLNNNPEYWLKIETQDEVGWMEMDYRGILKNHEKTHCVLNP